VPALLAGRRVAVSAGLQQRDFMHVEDVARAFVALLDGAFQGPVNIASGTAVAVRELVERIGALTGRTALIDVGARLSPPDEPASLSADIAALAEAIGFTPRYELASGLEQTVNWWRDQRRD